MLTYDMKKSGDSPLYLYLYNEIKNDIIAGKLKNGEKLPSKRSFAEHLGVSVITIEYAYNVLFDEGYIYSEERRGYFVCNIENPFLKQTKITKKVDFEKNITQDEEIDFPFSQLSKIMKNVINSYDKKLLAKPPHAGCPCLRRAIAEYLSRYRGMNVEEEQVIIGSGAENLYSMIVHIFGREKVIGIEDPSYEKIKDVYTLLGANIKMLPLDEYGIKTSALEKSDIDILHVTPFHSFPAGITANAAKRIEYISYMKKKNGFIIEDDFESEFAIGSKPVETIYSMDKSGSVIYINTFSKSLAPSMRLGYMVLPKNLLPIYEENLGCFSSNVPAFDQYVIAEFIESGGFERHLSKMRRKLRQAQSKKN